jgi:hypothetical protein
MCLACEREALYFAYLKQMAARAEAQERAKANQSAFSADAAEEDADPATKPGGDEPR